MQLTNLIKVKNIIKISPDITLSKALSSLSSSHDSAFVFDENKKYIGIINPYYCLIRSSHPGNSKVENCLFHPPRVNMNYSVGKIAQLMIESKIHYLPAFNEKKEFIGIVSARHILTILQDSKAFDLKIKDYLKLKKAPLITIYEDDLVTEALRSFKKHKVSKLIVIDKNMKLKGIIAHYDLINYLVSPREKKHKGDKKGSRTDSFKHSRIINFTQKYVLTLNPNNTLKQALDMIIEKSIGSVVITDNSGNPIGIITTRDFLSLLNQATKRIKIEEMVKNLTLESSRAVRGFFIKLSEWSRRIPNISKFKLFF
ncbi:MAG: CBS domain-containing protein [Patescibacteria group bacterium]